MRLIRLRYFLNGRGESRFFFLRSQPSFRRQGESYLLTTHSMTDLSKTPLVPRYLGGRLFIKSPASYQWPMLDLPLPVIGASSFIFVPCF